MAGGRQGGLMQRVPGTCDDGEVYYLPGLFDRGEAADLFASLRQEVAWRHEEIMMFGRPRLVPRLVAWHGDADARYTYSGVLHLPEAWTVPLLDIRQRVEQAAAHGFNSVLLNLYRDGRDSMGWHADDEPELGREPVIASVSLGATRRFRMRHRRRRDVVDLDLEDGSLLVMRGPTQHHWLHALPRTARPAGERINLTFRCVTPAGG